MKFRVAQDVAESIAAQILADNMDKVKDLAAQVIKKQTNSYEAQELGIQLIFDQYQEIIRRMRDHSNPSRDRNVRVARYGDA